MLSPPHYTLLIFSLFPRSPHSFPIRCSSAVTPESLRLNLAPELGGIMAAFRPALFQVRHPAIDSRRTPPGCHFRKGTRRRATGIDRKSTPELQSLAYLVCRLLLEKKKQNKQI